MNTVALGLKMSLVAAYNIPDLPTVTLDYGMIYQSIILKYLQACFSFFSFSCCFSTFIAQRRLHSENIDFLTVHDRLSIFLR